MSLDSIRKLKNIHSMVRGVIAFISVFLLVAMFWTISSSLLPTADGTVARFYTENSLEEIISANAVNAVIWEFRGYDTLGEELVIIAASLGVFLLLYKERR